MLMFADNIESGRAQAEELRLALISSGKYNPAALLGIETGDSSRSDARPADAVDAAGDALEDYSEVQWESPSSSEEVMSDLEKFNQVMTSNETISLGEDEEGEWL